MATKKPAAKAAPGKQLANWDEELAKYATAIADNERASGGGLKTFSTRAGVLSLDDAPMPGNQMAVIILAQAYDNVYYGEKFDADRISPPVCFARALREVDLAPHETVVERDQAQHEQCEGCPMNEWGTADTGRGKACSNSRQLVVIPAGAYDKRGELTLIDEVDHFESVEAAFLRPPVTSVKGFVSYVKQIATVLRKPPFAVITRVALVPDAKTQFKMEFEAIAPVEHTELFDILLRRHQEAEKVLLETPRNLDEREQPQPRGRSRNTLAPAKKGVPVRGAAPAKKGTAKKY